MLHAVLASVLLGVISTLGDFVWAHWQVRHRVVYGLIHGAAICLCIGAVIGARWRQPAAGAAVGPLIGVLAATSFYLLAPLLRYSAMFPAWMLFWICFGLLQARLSRVGTPKEALVRGVIAAAASGLAFYLVSDMWTRPSPGGPDYAGNLVRWTVAFLPGFVALFWHPVRANRDVQAYH